MKKMRMTIGRKIGVGLFVMGLILCGLASLAHALRTGETLGAIREEITAINAVEDVAELSSVTDEFARLADELETLVRQFKMGFGANDAKGIHMYGTAST